MSLRSKLVEFGFPGIRFIQILVIFFVCISGHCQNLSQKRLNNLSKQALPGAIEDFSQFLSIPNDGRQFSDLQDNMNWCRAFYDKLGFVVEFLETGTVPLLLAHKNFPGATRTVLFYTQIDGQPADPGNWEQENPFIPVLKEQDAEGNWVIIPWPESNFNNDWRIYARSASDSKGPAIMLMKALEILSNERISTPYNIKVLMDFQEEKGSPELPGAVNKYRNRLQADYLVIMDGVRSVKNVPTLTYGARGIVTMTLKIFGSSNHAHSGQFGNYVPNPVFLASRLLASMKNEDGRVLIPGFYEGVELTESEKMLINELDEDEEQLLLTLGIAKPEAVGDTYQEALQYPTLNVRGMKSGWTGNEVRTIIPEDVVIEMDMRLVPETPGERQVKLIRDFILDQGFHFVQGEPTEEERRSFEKLISFEYNLGSVPFRTSYQNEMSDWLVTAITRATGQKPVQMRTTGGSQPIGPFINTLNIPAIAVRVPNPGSNIHAPNENIRIGNFLEGIATCLAILTQPIQKKAD